MRVGIRAALAVLVAAGCSSEHEIAVDLRTDFDPGREFIEVRTEAWRGSDPRGTFARPGEREEMTALTTYDFVEGRRVAELGDVEPGRWWIRVSLLRADGSLLASRLASLDVQGTQIVGLVITRSCAAVICPGAGDEETETECIGGRCNDPRCGVDGDGVECAPSACSIDEDCAGEPHADCATPVCVSDVCLLAADDSRCGVGSSCDVELGCTADPDAGPMTRDAGPGADVGPRADGAACECTPAATESSAQGCGRCGSEPTSRTCGADCRWGAWMVVGGCGGEGACSPGETTGRSEPCGPCGVTRSCGQTCNGSCNWDPESCGPCPAVSMCTDFFGATVCPGTRGCANCGADICVTCTCGSGGGWETCDGPICG